ncbi:MAG: Nudix family hydrolase [Pseudomonadota bacterium]
MTKIVHVAVGVILDKDGNILIAKRPEQTHQGGLWEFPGGKVEQGETLFAALRRELLEELAINISATEPLIKIRHDYGDKVVLLDVHKVIEFYGEPQSNEGQPILWVSPKDLFQYKFPAANRPIITAIHLPQRLLITGNANSIDEYSFCTERALIAGIRCVQLRVQNSTTSDFFTLAEKLSQLCNNYSAKLILNTSTKIFLNINTSLPHLGLHLNSQELMRCENRPVAQSILLGASCHNTEEIAQAEKVGVDYICLSPVAATESHPNAAVLGWENFSRLIESVAAPVFALGGMGEKDLPQAIAAGAQGIAGIGAWWD